MTTLTKTDIQFTFTNAIKTGLIDEAEIADALNLATDENNIAFRIRHISDQRATSRNIGDRIRKLRRDLTA